MEKRKLARRISVLLVVSMLLAIMPMTALAAGTQETGPESVYTEASEKPTVLSDASETAAVTTYEDFLVCLKVLEGYADTYASESGDNAVGLVINYIRTGIEKYNTDSWAILAGAENTAFTAYVAEQDKANGTTAQALRGIGGFTLPNGQSAEFAHMFGAINIAYYNNYAQTNVDFGGWAGDLVDLMEYTKGKLTGTDVEAMTREIRENYLGIDDEEVHTFGQLDIYGDLDAYYILTKLAGGSTNLSGIMESYFTSSLSDTERAVYFLSNRFSGSTTQEAVRSALYDAYKGNSGVILLEAERGLTGDDDLRTACCNAFADYLYDLAKDSLGGETEEGNDYYTVFSSSSSTLAPGITQDIKYAITADDKQIVYYVATVDVSREDVSIYANYHNNDGSEWAMSRVTDQMAAAQAKHSNPDDPDNYIPNYNTIVGVNADFYNMTTGAPGGALVMEGVTYHGVGSENFFAILDDGTPVIGSSGDWAAYEGRVKEAVGGSIFLVKNGEICVTTSADYYNSRASRTCVGITADGKVVLMVLDGRQEPFSAGGSAEEIAQIMLDAGCTTAINLDGGGSTTFAAKEEGADSVTVVNRPSDGYERSVSSSLLVVSTAKTSNEFDHARISSDTDYLTIGSSLQVTVYGVSVSGNAAEIPEGAFLRISDESVATLRDSTITAVANGDVTVELVVGDTVVGSKTLHVVVPDSLVFEKENLNVIYGVPTRLPLLATYQGNPVTINENDILTGCEYEEAGVIEGFMFTGIEESGIRTMLVAAVLLENEEAYCEMQVSMYKNDEAIFDFDNATSGNRAFAWNRDVSNSTTDDEVYYHVVDPEQEMIISYIFALDMKEIEIPEQIKPLMSLLPGGDDPNATAWDFLLQLAERVSVLTEVRVQLQVDPNLDFDFSEIVLVNEYFTMSTSEFDDESHTLTLVCNWIDQTQAIDPATANPICILSGIKATPKADAQWDENGCLAVSNAGQVSYDIYLRSNTLYSVASDPSIQETYGLVPFINPYDSNEKGAHFGTTYATFEDSFTLDKSNWQGWRQSGDDLYYFVDNAAVTGIHKVPGYQDEENSYYYDFGDDGISKGKITGLFELNGNTYYAINGTLKTGWRPVNNGSGKTVYYYFDPVTGYAVDGEQTIGGYHYIFTDKILTRGDLIRNEKGVKYMWAGQWVSQQWMTVDGKEYYFRSSEYAATGLYAFNIEGVNVFYAFDENGVWQKDQSGLYDWAGNTYLIEDGIVIAYPGLVLIDGYYYYFAYYHNEVMNAAVKSCSYWISKTNGLMPEGSYTFDDQGRMTNPPVTDPDPVDPDPTDPEPEVKNGIVAENDSLYYYVDGVLTYAGLIQIDGDYYYVRGSGELVHGRSYWITKTNDLLPQGMYSFGEDGKMVDPPATEPDPKPTPDPEPEVKNGIVAENGSLYYYVDGVLTYAGLIQIDGDYYYVRGTGEVVNNRSYWITKTNGLLPEGSYTFDKDGKMVDPPATDPTEPEPEVKNGIVAENDSLYYYVNGKLNYAGLIQIDGDFYYVRTSGEVVHGRSYWITKTNNLMPEGSYIFDDEGKMMNPPPVEGPTDPEGNLKNGIVAENGSLYYYVDGVLTYAGLIQIDGDYYYVKTSCEVVHGRSYWITKTNNLMPEGSYIFDDEGKMMNPPPVEDPTDPEGNLKNGIVAENGSLYYYVDGVLTYAGLIQIDGDYYYVKTSCEVVHGRSYWITKTNGLLPEGSYTFDDSGRIVF